jgi:hypothetical protein
VKHVQFKKEDRNDDLVQLTDNMIWPNERKQQLLVRIRQDITGPNKTKKFSWHLVPPFMAVGTLLFGIYFYADYAFRDRIKLNGMLGTDAEKAGYIDSQEKQEHIREIERIQTMMIGDSVKVGGNLVIHLKKVRHVPYSEYDLTKHNLISFTLLVENRGQKDTNLTLDGYLRLISEQGNKPNEPLYSEGTTDRNHRKGETRKVEVVFLVEKANQYELYFVDPIGNGKPTWTFTAAEINER